MFSLSSTVAPFLIAGLVAGAVGALDYTAAAVRETSDLVLVREGEVVGEDLFAIANSVRVDGTIEGDLIVLSDRVEVNGAVTGDLIGFARVGSISGSVGGSVRLGGGSLVVTGSVGDDILAAIATVTVEGDIGRDVAVWGTTVRHRGSIGRDLDVRLLRSVTISGSVERNVDVIANSLALESTASVGGTVVYRSNIDAEVSDQASVGRIVVREPQTTPVQLRAARLLIIVLLAIGFILLGVGAFWMFPRSLRRAIGAIFAHPIRTVLVGVAVVAVPMVLVGLAAIMLSVAPIAVAAPALALLIPALVVATVLLFSMTIIAPIPVLTAVGRNLGSDRSSLGAFVLAAPVFLILILVPYVGSVVAAVVILFGLGAWASGWFGSRGDTGWVFRGKRGRARHRSKRRAKQEPAPISGAPQK